MSPFSLRIDCQGTVDCVAAGPGTGASSGDLRPRLWGRIWASFSADDISDVREVKARATASDVDAGRISPADRKANLRADVLAKEGAELHGLSEGDAAHAAAADAPAPDAGHSVLEVPGSHGAAQ
ncbi:unnamed protein product, partial [Prorocentrum cordatum]